MNKYNCITMFNNYVEFKGIKLNVDPVNKKRTDNDDNAMAIFYEEQPYMWLYFKDLISNNIKTNKGKIDFLDVGCGSGFWAIIVKKKIGGNIIAIDKSLRSVNVTKENCILNNVFFEIKHDKYSISSVGNKSTKVVAINPPYHIYPKELEKYIPLHARGGSWGLSEFYSQLDIAKTHIVNEGIIVFNMMSLGNDQHPDYVNTYRNILNQNVSLFYQNVFEPISCKEFLKGLYDNNFSKFQEQIYNKFSKMYYTIGYFKFDGKGDVEIIKKNGGIELNERSWDNRIELHKEINKHAKLKW